MSSLGIKDIWDPKVMVSLHGLEGLGFTVSTPNKYRTKPRFGVTQVSKFCVQIWDPTARFKIGSFHLCTSKGHWQLEIRV